MLRVALATAALWLALASAADGHGEAEWIARGSYKNAAGELCCGERDCVVIEPEHIKYTSGFGAIPQRGYLWFPDINKNQFEFIPEDQVLPSPDGQYWRCQWGGERKCFFAPPPGS